VLEHVGGDHGVVAAGREREPLQASLGRPEPAPVPDGPAGHAEAAQGAVDPDHDGPGGGQLAGDQAAAAAGVQHQPATQVAQRFQVEADPGLVDGMQDGRRAVGDRGRFGPAQGRLERLPFTTGSFDAVVAADVLEHLPDLPAAVAELARVLAPGGSFLFDTINRTPWAWFVAVFGLEQVLRMVPRGTHDWRLFIRPAELDRLLRRSGLEPVRLTGLAPQIGPGTVARGLLTRRIDVPSFATGNGRRASYLGHYRKASG